jgi:uncharacterized BrkB/YihY/UPF0761 family membrane protein
MGGLAIAAITLVGIVAFILLVWASSRLLEAMNAFYNDTQGRDVAKALLLIPYILLTAWVLVIKVVLFLITLGLAIDAAGNLRDWWHKGR